MTLKSFSSGLLIALTLFTTACGSPSLGEPSSRSEETYVGEFKSLGSIKVSSIVTHLFEDQDGNVLYAYSDRYNLDDELGKTWEAYGVLSTYAEVDKPIFEVKRLTEPDEEVVDPTQAATQTEYRNSRLGVTFSIMSDWTIDESTAGKVLFTLGSTAEKPIDESTEAMELTPKMPSLPDSIELNQVSANLTKTSDDPQTDREKEISDYVALNYSNLQGMTPDSSSMGPDHVLSLRYKTSGGWIYYFIPRGTDLFELSYHNLSEDDTLRIANTNLFATLTASFRFIPQGEETTDSPAETPSTPSEPSAPSVTQVENSKYATLTSNTFSFSMSYPSSWYYMGGSTGYSFNTEEVTDVNETALIKMSFNLTPIEGTTRLGDTVTITRAVDSRTYTLSGPAEYETIMKTMLDSIQTTKAE